MVLAPASTPPGVLLLGHGSARSAASAEPLLALADRLRAGGFEEVRTAFWKEEPFLHQALDTLRTPDAVVLPVFLAEGYFSRTVVPRELGLAYGPNRRDGRTIRLLPPLGTARGLTDLVTSRALEGAGPDAAPSRTALVVMGHGTPRDPGSAQAVLDVCAQLEREHRFARVAPAFIDQDPRVEQVVADAREAFVVVVPFLVAEGWHGGVTVPHELGLVGGTASRVRYAEPVGTHPGILDVVAAMLGEGAGSPAEAGEARGAATPLARAEHALLTRLAEQGSARILEAHVRATSGAWEIRHVADVALASDSLTPIADAPALERLARGGASGAHRPLRTAAGLARGWRFSARTAHQLGDALVALYGSALTHWDLGRSGELPRSSFRETAARQTGMYARLAHVEPAAVEAAVARVCDGCPCLRRRLWTVSGVVDVAENEKGAGGTLAVPCPAPCPVLLTTVLELADPAGGTAGDPKGD